MRPRRFSGCERLASCPTREGLGLGGWDLQVRFLLGAQETSACQPLPQWSYDGGDCPEVGIQQSICSWQSLTILSLGCPFRYSPKSPALQSETVHYKRGVSQQFSLPSFKIDFSEWKDDEVTSWLDLPSPQPLA